jgi:hypothetical protein
MQVAPLTHITNLGIPGCDLKVKDVDGGMLCDAVNLPLTQALVQLASFPVIYPLVRKPNCQFVAHTTMSLLNNQFSTIEQILY